MAVVRSALRQALAGRDRIAAQDCSAASSAGRQERPIAPAPIAFPPRPRRTDRPRRRERRRAWPRSSPAGPAMGVQLDTARRRPTTCAGCTSRRCTATWAEEGFFERSFAFVTQRGPRERIRAYLAARAEEQKPELSAEDAATLQRVARTSARSRRRSSCRRWPTARLAAVEAVLRDKGIDAARISARRAAGGPADEADGRRSSSAHREEPRAEAADESPPP